MPQIEALQHTQVRLDDSNTIPSLGYSVLLHLQTPVHNPYTTSASSPSEVAGLTVDRFGRIRRVNGYTYSLDLERHLQGVLVVDLCGPRSQSRDRSRIYHP